MQWSRDHNYFFVWFPKEFVFIFAVIFLFSLKIKNFLKNRNVIIISSVIAFLYCAVTKEENHTLLKYI